MIEDIVLKENYLYVSNKGTEIVEKVVMFEILTNSSIYPFNRITIISDKLAWDDEFEISIVNIGSNFIVLGSSNTPKIFYGLLKEIITNFLKDNEGRLAFNAAVRSYVSSIASDLVPCSPLYTTTSLSQS